MISAADLDRVLVEALPELASDRDAFELRRAEDPEFCQRFVGYSFIPTLQVALDQGVEGFCRRAFALIERLVLEGDDEIQSILREEFFEYGPACDKWMRRAYDFMGPSSRSRALRDSSHSV